MTQYSPGTGTTAKTKATHEIHNTSNITEIARLRQDKAELLRLCEAALWDLQRNNLVDGDHSGAKGTAEQAKEQLEATLDKAGKES